MARGRLLSKSISTSRKFAALAQRAGKLGEFAQTLYLVLTPHADDFGRLDGDPFTVKHLVLPTSPRSERDFEVALEAMTKVGLIAWYVVDDRRCIEITGFEKHQPGLHKRTQSHFPDPPAKIPGNSGKAPEILGTRARAEREREERYMGDETPPVPLKLHPPAGNPGKNNGRPRVRDPYETEFNEQVKPKYPSRDGDQRWNQACSHYRAARKAGEPAEKMLAGVERYASWCRVRGLVGTDKVKQAATFFGREECWKEPWITGDSGRRGFVG